MRLPWSQKQQGQQAEGQVPQGAPQPQKAPMPSAGEVKQQQNAAPPPPQQQQQQEEAPQQAAPPAAPAGDQAPRGEVRRRVGRWTIDQLRQTDGIIPLQYGTNRFASQRGMTGFGTPRNTSTRVLAENLTELPEDIARISEGELRLQSGTNKFASQRGMTGFGTGRDVVKQSNVPPPADVAVLPEEKERMTDGIVRLQSGTNRFASQRGMTGFGTARRELTKMLDSKHPEADLEHPDQSNIPLQSGTNRFASQKGMTGFGTARRELTKMHDEKNPEFLVDHPDQSILPLQMGTNKFASQAGMTSFGAFRLESLNPGLGRQQKDSQGIIPSQMGSNQFASQAGMTGFGTPRDVNYSNEIADLPFEELKKSEALIPSQAGWNKGASQKGMTGFGASRDVKGKHLKRLWELEYPEDDHFL